MGLVLPNKEWLLQQHEFRKSPEKRLRRIRKGQDVPPAPIVHANGMEWDRILYLWSQDLDSALMSLGRALKISSTLDDDSWTNSNSDYIAMCKWIQAALDGIQQWDKESLNPLAMIASSLQWPELRTLRNNLTHAFANNVPSDVKRFVDNDLPSLRLLVSLISILPKPRPTGRPSVEVTRLYSAETMAKQGVNPFTPTTGAKFGGVGDCLINIAYDQLYTAHFTFVGYEPSGTLWAAELYHSDGGSPETPR